jgi:hypothetical protein
MHDLGSAGDTHDRYGLGTVTGVEDGVAGLIDFGAHVQRTLTPSAKLIKLLILPGRTYDRAVTGRCSLRQRCVTLEGERCHSDWGETRECADCVGGQG